MPRTYFRVPNALTLPPGFAGRLVNLIPADTSAEGRAMLARLTEALGLRADTDVCTLDVGADVAAASALAHGPAAYVCAYGLGPRQVGARWTATPYRWLADGAAAWCFAERPEAIAADHERKKALWGALRRITKKTP